MTNKKKGWTFSIVLVVILSISSLFLLGFKITKNKTPLELYAVYLDGTKIGIVHSKEKFNKYISEQEEKLKEQYQVNEIYTPKGVEIKKIVTYDKKVNTNEEIYQKLTESENFTIKGITLDIKKEETVDNNKTEKIIKINLLDKEMFDNAIVEIIKAFIDDEKYDKFMSSTQEPITDTGEIIEDIHIKEEIIYKESYIPTNETIFTNVDDLKRYLLYGTTEKQKTYTVKSGDTIETIANKHKLNVQEFLIANPEFTSANNLLYASQKVNVGLINPIISVVVETHAVTEEVQKYATEIKYDETLVIGYSYVERNGEDGLDKITRKHQYINGQMADVAMVSKEEIKPSVSKILVKGEKYIPNVADLSYWALPVQRPYYITSGYGYRWGTMHHAIDFYVGHGSAIYAANNGTVYEVGTGCVRGDTKCNSTKGNYVVINHNIKYKNYYGNIHSQYLHLDKVYVKAGQTVYRGQKIGTMGNTGYVVPTPGYGSNSLTGTHLHFEIWSGLPYVGTHHNPMKFY